MYEIRENRQYGSREIYFDGKPSAETRTALKELKLRWNPKKKCWYGFADEHSIVSAINGSGESVVTDGYLGGGAFYGANSNKALYGSDLSKAVRQAMKQAGIKGVTVSCKSYTGGQSLTVKVKSSKTDFISLDEYVEGYRLKLTGWITTSLDGECIFSDAYWDMTAEEQEEVRRKAAETEYKRVMKGTDINHYHMNDYTMFTKAFAEKLDIIHSIIKSFHYDESNSMVDYYSTNFYYDIELLPVLEA